MKSIAFDAFSDFSGSMVTGGPTKQTFSFGFESFIISAMRQSTSKPGVEVNSTSSSKSLRHFDGLLDRNPVRRRIHHFAVGQHAGRIAKPHRIPVGFDLARGRPARTRPAVKALEKKADSETEFACSKPLL